MRDTISAQHKKSQTHTHTHTLLLPFRATHFIYSFYVSDLKISNFFFLFVYDKGQSKSHSDVMAIIILQLLYCYDSFRFYTLEQYAFGQIINISFRLCFYYCPLKKNTLQRLKMRENRIEDEIKAASRTNDK